MSYTDGTANFNFYNTKRNSGNKTIFDLERDLVSQIDSLNREYLKYFRCKTLYNIKSGSDVSLNFTTNLKVDKLNCPTVPTSKDNRCKITGVNNAQKILIKGPGSKNRINTSAVNTVNKVEWDISYNTASGATQNTYVFEVSGNDTYVYKKTDSVTSFTDISYQILDSWDCSGYITSNELTTGSIPSTFTTKFADLSQIYIDMSNIIGRITSSNGKISDASFNEKHTVIQALHGNITTMRSELDTKMNDIMNQGKNTNGYKYDKNIMLDSTVYSSLAWTILATSLLYYVFVKME
jgi:hypothetical protein